MKVANILRTTCTLALLLAAAACDPPEPTPEAPFRLDVPPYFGPYSIPEDNTLTQAGVELGRMLFYDPRLSADNSISCASCHQRDHAFSDPRPQSLGVNGARGAFNAMSLQNLLWNERFFWDGRTESLEVQALEPIEDPVEMHQPLPEAVAKLSAVAEYRQAFLAAFGSAEVTAEGIGKALAQFERTLVSGDSKYDRYLRGEYTPTEQELQGIDLFYTHPVARTGLRGANCGDCHLGPLTSGSLVGFEGFHNNGLDGDAELDSGLMVVTGRSADRGRFKAPTLRNIALTAPYMHDGRLATLEEVIDHYNVGVQGSATLDVLIVEATNLPDSLRVPGQVRLGLTEEEKVALLAFLNMLTDSTFITNEANANPFE